MTLSQPLALQSPEFEPQFRSYDAFLRRAEAEIALIDRSVPLNVGRERQRLFQSWQAGQRVAPAFQYAMPPSLGPLRRALLAIADECVSANLVGQLYAARALELELEARCAEALGTPAFAELAAQRYAIDVAEHARAAETWARTWVGETCAAPAGALHRSDDINDPQSLISSMRRAVGRLRLPLRVEVRTNQVAAAATGDGWIAVRPQIMHRERDVARIVLHEIEAHALPRIRAKTAQIGLFAVGSAQSSDDEEGRALLIERRAGYLDIPRRVELGRRHLAALSVRNGADWVQTTEHMLELGAPLDTAQEHATRAHRGGGLAREVVYLVALSRVGRALEREPRLEQWLERGRLSVVAAEALATRASR
jgi:hypothetical protein